MKRMLILLVGLALTVSVYAASIVDMTVSPGQGRITVRWESADESGLSRFVLQRCVDNGEYNDVATITPRGNHISYQFIDTDLYTADRTARTFGYRLKFVNRDGTSGFSGTRETTMQISSIRRTWGSIKAMFR